MRPLTPIVASERKVARSTLSPMSASVATGATSGIPGAAAVTGCAENSSRTQRKPKTSATIAPTISAGTLIDEPDEDTRDADREADRPEARAREVLGVVLVAHSGSSSVPCSGS